MGLHYLLCSVGPGIHDLGAEGVEGEVGDKLPGLGQDKVPHSLGRNRIRKDGKCRKGKDRRTRTE